MAASVDAADAYVFVTPGYNFRPPPSLLNALKYVYKEVELQALVIVSYGGVSGGVHSALVEEITLTTLKMMPMVETVSEQNIARCIHANNNLVPTGHHLHGAESLLNESYK
ncbi:NADPH-dependent FMN reductase [Nitrosospira sp. Nsp2]|uniref:NADPH-dependent FMN reductase n=1 Tax=Nitrosospira sp. Nsp2 TaxID=136548 RepID=UPI002159A932|nr:NAD(P)H-dependent oxidoreductase [Nitrosospira sp. Nsp2]